MYVSSFVRSYMQGYLFCGISGNLDQGIRLRSIKSQEKTESREKVRESAAQSGKFDCGVDTFSDHHITYLYFIRTVIRFSYVMFTKNVD